MFIAPQNAIDLSRDEVMNTTCPGVRFLLCLEQSRLKKVIQNINWFHKSMIIVLSGSTCKELFYTTRNAQNGYNFVSHQETQNTRYNFINNIWLTFSFVVSSQKV